MAQAELEARVRGKMRLGAWVFAGLLALDAFEYMIAQTADQVLLWMALLAFPQALLIVRFYMHVKQLKHPEET